MNSERERLTRLNAGDENGTEVGVNLACSEMRELALTSSMVLYDFAHQLFDSLLFESDNNCGSDASKIRIYAVEAVNYDAAKSTDPFIEFNYEDWPLMAQVLETAFFPGDVDSSTQARLVPTIDLHNVSRDWHPILKRIVQTPSWQSKYPHSYSTNLAQRYGSISIVFNGNHIVRFTKRINVSKVQSPDKNRMTIAIYFFVVADDEYVEFMKKSQEEVQKDNNTREKGQILPKRLTEDSILEPLQFKIVSDCTGFFGTDTNQIAQYVLPIVTLPVALVLGTAITLAIFTSCTLR